MDDKIQAIQSSTYSILMVNQTRRTDNNYFGLANDKDKEVFLQTFPMFLTVMENIRHITYMMNLMQASDIEITFMSILNLLQTGEYRC